MSYQTYPKHDLRLGREEVFVVSVHFVSRALSIRLTMKSGWRCLPASFPLKADPNAHCPAP